MQNADLGKRFLAYLIDAAIYFVGAMLTFIPLSIGIAVVAAFGKDGDKISVIAVLGTICLTLFIVIAILGWVFYIWIWHPYKNNGQSYGKKIMKIRIVRASNLPLTLWSYIGRFLIFELLGIISVITLFFDSEKRAIHDMVVDTRVVEE